MLSDLIVEYKRNFPSNNKNTCLKISYRDESGISVNLFFDAYDNKLLTLYIILNYKKEYYFTPAKIDVLKPNGNYYLTKCPQAILDRILLLYKNLIPFYNNMREHIKDYIIKSKNQQINLKSDYSDGCFRNALKKSKNEYHITPFLHYIRNTTMSKKQFIKLSDNLHIADKILIKLRKMGRTIVTTNDPLKRKTLTMVLDEVGHKI